MSSLKALYLQQPEHLNADKLREDLEAALGVKFHSVDTGVPVTALEKSGVSLPFASEYAILVRATGDATAEDAEAVEATLAAHDHTKRSKLQEKETARETARERLKSLDVKAALEGKKAGEDVAALADILQDIVQVLND